ncbi:N-acetylmuramoyl-L-alanine amidase [Microbulbifer halophilus]|uniref:N-acetylmuramoyl-L-alanine amidase n=2 Tax=Microbulbifer halophilus TaxID=453963 RepID=A0ABW5ELZ7_9GAMM|nr:peptidoglycan recognition family protein [Microbulbifer halophilus]MCW8128611.1 peptidoglycan recognition family protein [Microbulbifer halophilus]
MAEQTADRPQGLTARLAEEEARLLPQRRAYRRHFADAYAAYPSIPAGTLEAIAYVQSRWVHLDPDGNSAMQGHQHMPKAYGIMGLYAGGGAADQISRASAITGMKVQRIKRNPRSNILAAAALLDLELRKDVDRLGLLRGGMILQPTLEDMVPTLKRYAGFSEYSAKNVAQDYARTSFAYDVLLAQDRGVDDRGIRVPEKAVAWERAFTPRQLTTLRAPFVRLQVTEDALETREYRLDPITETLQRKEQDSETPVPQGSIDSDTQGEQGTESLDGPQSLLDTMSTDYGPALWVASPYYHSRSSYSSTTIHTAQGSYAGTINWFQDNPYSVSAHYVIRSSDGQVTQMVRNHHAAHHVGVHNGTTLGIEHEGYVDNSSWYTTAMYNSSAALVRSFCDSYAAIDCANAYDGPAHSDVVVLPSSIDVKGHQHYTSQTHTDPGINWNWSHYYTLLNPGSGGSTTVLDSFDSSEGHFYTSPTYSGSTVGISTQSSATRDCNISHGGSCSLRVLLKDDTGSNSDWRVRLLSGAGSPGANVPLSSNGRVGYWVYAAASGMRAAIGVDDSDGTERSYSKSLPADSWTFVEWNLADSDDWYAWAGGSNGTIDAGNVTLDAVWILRDPDTAYDVNVYIDEVQIQN